jgi:hypothetical protein
LWRIVTTLRDALGPAASVAVGSLDDAYSHALKCAAQQIEDAEDRIAAARHRSDTPAPTTPTRFT